MAARRVRWESTPVEQAVTVVNMLPKPAARSLSLRVATRPQRPAATVPQHPAGRRGLEWPVTAKADSLLVEARAAGQRR